ncbi:DUF1349 domain-containing protein [Pectobacterium polaris]|uniref:DUF1349 domain-containing protein n=1 Tax=Pectobacterium polaris TaxID=2042057 RepID=A0AAW5GBF4_9GAMM|nr:DUF1349 domain-containing protein [Pectobacterium polaris]MCL6367988.1 DUF1349 domain-containing protein [Pectobacterium polaris]
MWREPIETSSWCIDDVSGDLSGQTWPLIRLSYFPPGPVKIGTMCCTPERAGLDVVFQDILLTPPLDKALHDLS